MYRLWTEHLDSLLKAEVSVFYGTRRMVCFCHVTGRKCWKLGAVGSVFIYSSEVSKNKAGVFLLPGRPAVFSLTVSEPGSFFPSSRYPSFLLSSLTEAYSESCSPQSSSFSLHFPFTRQQPRLSILHPRLCICLLLGRQTKHQLKISKYNNKLLSK